MTAMLEASGLTKHFAGVAAVADLDVEIRRDEILAVIGPNGSGKTTLFNLLSGFLRPSAGRIAFEGRRVDGVAPHRLVRGGMARTFQQAMSFAGLTVRENVEVSIHAVGRRGFHEVDRILEECGLAEVPDYEAGTLPYGLQRNLGIAVALATVPKLLLLDEPAAGLGDEAARSLAALIRNIRDQGVTVAVVDHDMPFLMPLADRVLVMEAGRKLFEGTSDEVMSHDRVIEVYLGHAVE
ncbi:ABC transporter ATP-binding protein [Minwuia thermotolerans]|uniref:ABC transporter ATP-binding protein n=1 Tax=Minwuia thermotolerans TaxID=2056226 RepID=UPI000D6DC3C0|nr:ABC transporter ATP-binding protein [Minwuia thermotolerans]